MPYSRSPSERLPSTSRPEDCISAWPARVWWVRLPRITGSGGAVHPDPEGGAVDAAVLEAQAAGAPFDEHAGVRVGEVHARVAKGQPHDAHVRRRDADHIPLAAAVQDGLARAPPQGERLVYHQGPDPVHAGRDPQRVAGRGPIHQGLQRPLRRGLRRRDRPRAAQQPRGAGPARAPPVASCLLDDQAPAHLHVQGVAEPLGFLEPARSLRMSQVWALLTIRADCGSPYPQAPLVPKLLLGDAAREALASRGPVGRRKRVEAGHVSLHPAPAPAIAHAVEGVAPLPAGRDSGSRASGGGFPSGSLGTRGISGSGLRWTRGAHHG
jgi:hypothetical protein